jgi:hypothetical protein
MRKSFICITLAVICLSFTQDAGLIPWTENNKLSWADFKGAPNMSSPYKALTESTMTAEVSGKNTEAHISIKTFFDKSRSWVKEIKTDELLAHEQLHFDITELWARKFRQKLKGKTFSIKIFQRELKTIQSGIDKEDKAMQVEYDKETKHSEIAENQKKWEKNIKEELQKLNAFAETDISCILTK